VPFRIVVVALRVELSATRLSAEFGQPALDYHLPTSLSIQSGRRDSNPRSRAPTTTAAQRCPAGCRCPTSRHSVRTGGFEPPISWSPTRRDNQASPRSAASSSCGSRTRLCALKGRDPVPIDERAIMGAHLPRRQSGNFARRFHAVDWAVLESASTAFQAAAKPSQLPVQQKSPMSL
jgi:hypothetical protein